MKRVYVLTFVFISLLSLPFAQAAGQHWEFAGWYGGGCYPNVEFDPNVKDRVYLTSDVTGIWKSNDGGEQWAFITQGLGNLIVSQVAVAPADSNVIYAATQQGLFYSLDAGDHWQKSDDFKGAITFERPQNYRSVVVSVSNPQKVCVGTAKGKIFCSDNYGRKWKSINQDTTYFAKPEPITALAFNADDSQLTVANGQGLFRYTFQDRKWNSLLPQSYAVADFVLSQKRMVVAGDKFLMLSMDDGASWTQSSVIPAGKTYRVSLDKSQENPSILVAWLEDWKGGILISKDTGLSWNSLDTNLNADIVGDPTRAWSASGGKPTAVKMDPFNPQRFFRTDWWGVWRSDDGGTTWSEKIRGAANTVGSDIKIASTGEVFVATMDNGLLKSSDEGKSYQALFPKSGYQSDINGHVWRVVVSGDNVIASSSPWGKNINQIVVSTDGGKNFKIVDDGLPLSRPKGNTMWGEGYPRALAMDPKDPNIIYLGMDGDEGGGLFISTNGGNSWTRSSGQPGSLRIYNGLVVDTQDSNILFWAACGNNGGIYKSVDRGKNWQKVFSESSWIFDLHMSNNGTLYAAGASTSPAVYASKDKGTHWERIGDFDVDGSSAADAIISVPAHPEILAVSTVSWDSGGGQKIYLTRDAGKTWQDITGDLPSGAGAAAMTFDVEGKQLYMTRYAGSVYKLSL